MRTRFGPPVLIIAIFLISIYSALFTVEPSQQAIVLQFGEPVEGPLGPGLHLKIPFIQRTVKMDRYLLDYAPSEIELLSADKQKLLVSCYAKWQIADPLGFYRRVRDSKTALQRLDDIVGAELQAAFGKRRLSDMLAAGRSALVEEVSRQANDASKALGVALVDLQIVNIRLTPDNLAAVCTRMRAELAAQAQQLRSLGEQASLERMAQADRQRASILAEAQLQAATIRGQAEAEATHIFANAYGQDPEFFNFTRTLEASRKVLGDKSTLILSPDYEFLRFFKQSD
jgi:membrane protease subunit HflC